MMYVALSYDHRIVDGREAVSFLKRIQRMRGRSGTNHYGDLKWLKAKPMTQLLLAAAWRICRRG